MAIQSINIGTIANDGTGDDLRVAFNKVNANFSELDQRILPGADGQNIGAGTGIFYVKDTNYLQFKSLVAGDNINLSNTYNEITITADAISNITFNSDVGSLAFTGTDAINLLGGQNIDTSISGHTVTFAVDGNNLVVQDTSPTLGGNLNANTYNISGAGTITASSFVVDLTGLVYGLDMRYYTQNVREALIDTDYGSIDTNTLTTFELLLYFTPIDYGTFTSPEGLTSDYGTFTDPL